MNTTTRFNNAYNALVKAFFEGTLGKYNCAACACGNIIAAAHNCSLTPDEFKELCNPIHPKEGIRYKVDYILIRYKVDYILNLWADKRDELYNEYNEMIYVAFPKFENEVNAAGYTAAEFAQIETAFEKNTRISYIRYHEKTEQEILEDQFKGLCAVVDVLLKLDKISPDEKYNNKFREHPMFVLIGKVR